MNDKNEQGSTYIPDVSTSGTQRTSKSLEILLFGFFIAKTLSDTVIVNLLEARVCDVELNYNETICKGAVLPEVQERAATLVMVRSMIEAFVPSLLSLFIGPWSDTNGRRPIILLSLACYTVSTAMWCIFSLFPGMHPLYFLLTSVPVAMGGGYVSFFMAAYCYVSETTDPDGRALRLSVLEMLSLAGILVSSVGAPYLLSTSVRYGFSIVFATSAQLLLVTTLLTYFFLKESVTIIECERKRLWRLDHAKDVFATCFKSRPDNVRNIVMLLIANLALFILCFDGELKVLYMFSQYKFNWDLVLFTRFFSFVLILAGVSVVFCTWLFVSVLKMAELPVIVFGTVGLICKNILQAIATSGVLLYAAYSFTILTSIIMPLTRAQISKLIPSNELGKIFAFTAFVEATAPLAAAPLYTSLYKNTIETHPNAVFWLSTGLSYISFLMVGLALVIHRLSFTADPGLEPLLVPEDGVGEHDQAQIQ